MRGAAGIPHYGDGREGMMGMKTRNGLLLGAAFAAGIVAGPATGLLGQRLGLGWPIAYAAAQDGNRAETYRLLTLFGDVFERVRADYVETTNDRDLIENAINGMLTGLDPHSSYMNAKSYKDMQVQTKGEFGGLGLEVVAENGLIKVVSPMDDTPRRPRRHEDQRPDHHDRRPDRAGPDAERGPWTRCAAPPAAPYA